MPVSAAVAEWSKAVDLRSNVIVTEISTGETRARSNRVRSIINCIIVFLFLLAQLSWKCYICVQATWKLVRHAE
ncbi:unnamed protein product [Zymoseptoria tritici ST99CH_1E4]|uniref:Uncharacterized protein n=1 Tax=Zymoseptoria tritici ST99CH_1E4 TaxID=1276532 RepID=A0A2H1FLZ5_ZYMTR|nr:unnamed protein product [Zymoseptoria tritici ST99CH_1E4]